MSNLGVLMKIADLRTIWKHEEKDFSPWLAKEENLAILSNAIGIDIVFEELESSIGGYNVDLFGVEDGTNRRIIIENQLEDTNHDHLGKIITYAAGKDAEVIIWIVKKARDEHRQAIDWLNNHTDEKIGIFLIEIELWKIGDSLPAPKFTIISQPNDFAKIMKITGFSETKQTQYEFWKGFVEYANSPASSLKMTPGRKPRPQHWYNIAMGKADVHMALTANTKTKMIGAEIYIPDNKDLYNTYFSNKDIIESELGFNMDWLAIPDGKASRILISITGDLSKQSKWPEFYKWLANTAAKMREVFVKYYQ